MRSTLNTALRSTARRGVERLLSQPAVRDRLSRRAHTAWDRADSIAFVCLGNICRSPFAEAVARKRAPDCKLVSAGSMPQPGRPSPDQAVLSAGTWNIDLRPHRSRAFSSELAAEADAIFVFDFHNLRRVLMEHPRAIKRIHPLGALASEGQLFISDPFGGDRATFDETFEQIAAAIPGRDRRFVRNGASIAPPPTPRQPQPASPQRAGTRSG